MTLRTFAFSACCLLSLIAPPGGANKNALIPIGTSGAVIAGFVVPPKFAMRADAPPQPYGTRNITFDTRACGNGGTPAGHQDEIPSILSATPEAFFPKLPAPPHTVRGSLCRSVAGTLPRVSFNPHPVHDRMRLLTPTVHGDRASVNLYGQGNLPPPPPKRAEASVKGRGLGVRPILVGRGRADRRIRPRATARSRVGAL